MEIITVGIVGYGNLGKAVKEEINKSKDMKLFAVFTRRDPKEVGKNIDDVQFIAYKDIKNYSDKIDVLILCGGSATDLEKQSPYLSRYYNIVDSFDTHEKINDHFNEVDKSARIGEKTAVVSIGWDPGLFSLIRAISEMILIKGSTYTFWGKGVSQGHSDAIRRIKGVKDAIQYTIPIESALEQVRSFKNPILETRDKHIRQCYVVAEEGYDRGVIENNIKNMPYYFSDYDTFVTFIDEEEMKKYKEKLSHGGFVFRSGFTGKDDINNNIIEFSLKLDSNPCFTAGILIAYARAAYRLNNENSIGAKTILDIPISYLVDINKREIINKYL